MAFRLMVEHTCVPLLFWFEQYWKGGVGVENRHGVIGAVGISSRLRLVFDNRYGVMTLLRRVYMLEMNTGISIKTRLLLAIYAQR